MIVFPAIDEATIAPRPTPLFSAIASESVANKWVSVNGWSVSNVYSDVKNEYLALSEGAALIDTGALIRRTIGGVDAVAMLSRLTSVPIGDLNIGEIGRGLILDDHGFVVDHADVARLTGDLYLLTTSSPIVRRMQLATRGLEVDIENISDGIAALSIIGPDGRRVASRAGLDIGGDLLAAHSKLRGVDTCVRPIVLGNIEGVEVIYPAQEALVLWERLRRARHITPAGFDALSILRIEAGMPSLGVDFQSPEASGHGVTMKPKDIGLAHLTPLDRAWFNGRRALTGKPSSDRYLFNFLADADALQVGAKVFADDIAIGQVSSWGFSWKKRCAVGFATVMAGKAPDMVETDEGARPISALVTPEGDKAVKFFQETR